MLHARVIVRITCERCEANYEAALSLAAIVAVATAPEFTARDIPLPAPGGWIASADGARCPAHAPAAQGREEPTEAVLKRAAALQALARDPKTTDGERRNAWAQFEKLWQRYRLPEDLGL
jgi:hypothetical protein